MRKIILVFSIAVCSVSLFGQQDNTLYFLENVPQRNLVNPALNHCCKIYISGIFMPIAGQVLPPIHFNYNNNALSFKNVIYPGSGLYSDSLVTPFQKGEDPTKFFNRLHQVNYMSVENHIDLISLGYRWKDFYFDFHIAEKTEFRVSFPKDLMVLGWEGNAGQSLLGQEAFLSFLGATATHYREYAWGTSWKMNDKLTLGGTAKLLFGKANLYSKKTDLTFTTREDDFAYTINADMEVYSSQPIFDVLELYYDYEGDSIVYKDTTYDDVTAKQMIFNTKNPGTAIDLGASYKFNDKISFYASVLDIGFIKWKDNVNTFKLKGEYLWDGWHDIRPSLMQDSTLINETIDNYRDSVIHLFDPQYQETSYTQWLTPKFYLGGTYQFHEKLKVGMLLRGDVFQHRLHGGVTLSANSQLTKWFGTSVSYTIHNSSFNNVGLGLVFKIPWFQFYLVSDNVTSFIWPQATRNVNFRIGVNMLFGCDKKNSEAKLN